MLKKQLGNNTNHSFQARFLQKKVTSAKNLLMFRIMLRNTRYLVRIYIRNTTNTGATEYMPQTILLV